MNISQKMSNMSNHSATSLQELGALVSAHRRERKLTQQAVAEAAGIGRSTLNQLERGTANVSVSSLMRVLEVLGAALFIEEASARPTLRQLRREQERPATDES